jgi:hypothetical protein
MLYVLHRSSLLASDDLKKEKRDEDDEIEIFLLVACSRGNEAKPCRTHLRLGKREPAPEERERRSDKLRGVTKKKTKTFCVLFRGLAFRK